MSSSKRKFAEFKSQHIQQTLTHGQLMQMIQGHKRIKDAMEVMMEGQQMVLDALCASMAVKVGEPLPENVLPLPVEKDLQSFMAVASQSAGQGSPTKSSNNGGTVQKRQRRSKPEGPKKISGYLLFCEEERARPADERPAAQEFMTLLGHKWSQMSDEVKQAFNERAKQVNESNRKLYDEHQQSIKADGLQHGQMYMQVPVRMPTPPESVAGDEAEIIIQQKKKAPLVIPTMSEMMRSSVEEQVTATVAAEDAEKKKKKKKKNKDRHMIEQHMTMLPSHQ